MNPSHDLVTIGLFCVTNMFIVAAAWTNLKATLARIETTLGVHDREIERWRIPPKAGAR